VAWDVEFTDQLWEWFGTLDALSEETVFAAVEELRAVDPGLGRPWVDTVKRSRHKNMKELRPTRRNVRILFAFDPRRTVILLIGGEKTGLWNAWYDRIIPVADRLFDVYLEELREEGVNPREPGNALSLAIRC